MHNCIYSEPGRLAGGAFMSCIASAILKDLE